MWSFGILLLAVLTSGRRIAAVKNYDDKKNEIFSFAKLEKEGNAIKASHQKISNFSPKENVKSKFLVQEPKSILHRSGKLQNYADFLNVLTKKGVKKTRSAPGCEGYCLLPGFTTSTPTTLSTKPKHQCNHTIIMDHTPTDVFSNSHFTSLLPQNFAESIMAHSKYLAKLDRFIDNYPMISNGSDNLERHIPKNIFPRSSFQLFEGKFVVEAPSLEPDLSQVPKPPLLPSKENIAIDSHQFFKDDNGAIDTIPIIHANISSSMNNERLYPLNMSDVNSYTSEAGKEGFKNNVQHHHMELINREWLKNNVQHRYVALNFSLFSTVLSEINISESESKNFSRLYFEGDSVILTGPTPSTCEISSTEATSSIEIMKITGPGSIEGPGENFTRTLPMFITSFAPGDFPCKGHASIFHSEENTTSVNTSTHICQLTFHPEANELSTLRNTSCTAITTVPGSPTSCGLSTLSPTTVTPSVSYIVMWSVCPHTSQGVSTSSETQSSHSTTDGNISCSLDQVSSLQALEKGTSYKKELQYNKIVYPASTRENVKLAEDLGTINCKDLTRGLPVDDDTKTLLKTFQNDTHINLNEWGKSLHEESKVSHHNYEVEAQKHLMEALRLSHEKVLEILLKHFNLTEVSYSENQETTKTFKETSNTRFPFPFCPPQVTEQKYPHIVPRSSEVLSSNESTAVPLNPVSLFKNGIVFLPLIRDTTLQNHSLKDFRFPSSDPMIPSTSPSHYDFKNDTLVLNKLVTFKKHISSTALIESISQYAGISTISVSGRSSKPIQNEIRNESLSNLKYFLFSLPNTSNSSLVFSLHEQVTHPKSGVRNYTSFGSVDFNSNLSGTSQNLMFHNNGSSLLSNQLDVQLINFSTTASFILSLPVKTANISLTSRDDAKNNVTPEISLVASSDYFPSKTGTHQAEHEGNEPKVYESNIIEAEERSKDGPAHVSNYSGFTFLVLFVVVMLQFAGCLLFTGLATRIKNHLCHLVQRHHEEWEEKEPLIQRPRRLSNKFIAKKFNYVSFDDELAAYAHDD